MLGKDGKLAATITWDRGVKEGKEITCAEGGKKVVKEIVWKPGEMTQVTELFLNGNPSLKEAFANPARTASTGPTTRAAHARGGDLPARQAPRAQPELVGERQARERRGLRRRQADPGQALGQGRQLLSDDEFEADGSRKLKR